MRNVLAGSSFSTALLVASLSLAAAPSAREFAQALRYAQHGLAAVQRGNASRAAQDFDRALRAVPDLPEAHIGRGHLATREKRFDDALREYRAAEDGYRKLEAFLLQFADERYARSRDELQHLQQVKDKLDQMAERSQMRAPTEGDATGGLNPGQVERMRAEVDARIQELQAMALPIPDASHEPPALIYFFEGNALFALGRTDEAIAAWERARSRDSRFAPVDNNLAVAYWRRGRLDDARAALARAEKLGFDVNPRFRADLESAVARARRGGN